ncbi:MAG: type II toxin-antitoxin system HicA family toxin [Chloroflexi bacterium]|nr:type II toxin-antitoxin system HicA family toxin [Chloroflexota bacterium]
MSDLDKLIERIRSRPPVADFEDVRKLLEAFGWVLNREKGSHAMFTKEGERTISVPKVHGRKVKRVYLDMICEILGLDD